MPSHVAHHDPHGVSSVGLPSGTTTAASPLSVQHHHHHQAALAAAQLFWSHQVAQHQGNNGNKERSNSLNAAAAISALQQQLAAGRLMQQQAPQAPQQHPSGASRLSATSHSSSGMAAVATSLPPPVLGIDLNNPVEFWDAATEVLPSASITTTLPSLSYSNTAAGDSPLFAAMGSTNPTSSSSSSAHTSRSTSTTSSRRNSSNSTMSNKSNNTAKQTPSNTISPLKQEKKTGAPTKSTTSIGNRSPVSVDDATTMDKSNTSGDLEEEEDEDDEDDHGLLDKSNRSSSTSFVDADNDVRGDVVKKDDDEMTSTLFGFDPSGLTNSEEQPQHRYPQLLSNTTTRGTMYSSSNKNSMMASVRAGAGSEDYPYGSPSSGPMVCSDSMTYCWQNVDVDATFDGLDDDMLLF
jgi:hypothetical protein